MKKLLWVAFGAVIFTACKNGNSADTLSGAQKDKFMKDSSNYTTIEWLDPVKKDLGEIKEGEKVTVTYRFRNSGNHNLVIGDVSAECGCTTPDQPKEPIAPGKEGEIKAVFNSTDRMGENNKHVFVTSNTLPNSTTLAFHVVVTK